MMSNRIVQSDKQLGKRKLGLGQPQNDRRPERDNRERAGDLEKAL
jgi:hypothetical protein